MQRIFLLGRTTVWGSAWNEILGWGYGNCVRGGMLGNKRGKR